MPFLSSPESDMSSPTVPPFPAFPAASRYVELGSTGETLSRLFRAVDAREAISTVIGPPGVGKSLVADLVADGHRDSHDVVVLNQTPLQTKDALIEHLLHGLGVQPQTGVDLHLQLVDRVCSSVSRSGLLVVVDEAQSLANEVLEAVRMVTNITARGQRRVMAVLCGSSQMDERLTDPSMEALVQRVATRCYLHPLDEGATRAYVRQTISACGSDPDHTITDPAVAAVHLASGGVPRLINQMMTEAIDCAARQDQGLIDADTVNLAWSNLQQLPAPMVDEPAIGPVCSSDGSCDGTLADAAAGDAMPVIFGSLEEQSSMDADEFGDAPANAALATMDSADIESEPAEEIADAPALAPTAEELFGQFGEEVAIEVGSAAVQSAAAPITTADDELEMSLQREVEDMMQSAACGTIASDDLPPAGGEMYRELEPFEQAIADRVQDEPSAETLTLHQPGGETLESGSLQDIEFGCLGEAELSFEEPESTAEPDGR